MAALLFRILGDLEVVQDARPVPLGSHQQRAVLAMLVLHAGEIVPAERLIDGLWGDAPPATAAKTVQVYVSRLRHALGAPDVIATRDHGYALHAGRADVDLAIFERLTAEARAASAAGDADQAAAALREGLALWRGDPLAEFAGEPFARPEIGRLQELRLEALELRAEADLALGRHAALAGELQRLADEHPYRERLHELLMLALYRCGRQSDALAAYRRTRAQLVDELGIEPGPALRELHEAILRQDPGLDAPAAPTPPPGAETPAPAPHRRRRLTALAAVAALAGGVGLVALVLGDRTDHASATVAPNSVAELDAGDGHLLATVAAGARPGPIVVTHHVAWVANQEDRTITRIDAGGHGLLGTSTPGGYLSGLTAAPGGGVWVVDGTTGLARRLEPSAGTVAKRLRLRGRAEGPPQSVDVGAPAATGDGALWVAHAGVLTTIGLRGGPSTPVTVGESPSAIAVGATGTWVTDDLDNDVRRVVAGTVVGTTPTGAGPESLAIGAGGVWVAQRFDGTVARLDPDSGRLTDTIHVGAEPRAIAVADGTVWVANSGDGTLSRIDAARRKVTRTVPVGGSPAGLAVDGDHLWVTVQAPPAAVAAVTAGHGGVANVDLNDAPTSLDPALAYGGSTAPQVQFATCARLYTYPDASGAAGARLIPEVAAGPPAVSRDGLRYRFRIRRGFRFSPPSGAPVTAAAFRRAFERMAHPLWAHMGVGAPAYYFQDIAGAAAYRAGRARHISGVVARANTLLVRLRRPLADLPQRLSVGFFCAVPPDAPVRRGGIASLPSAGPFYVQSVTPDRQIVLARNPYYRGARRTHLDAIDIRIGRPPETAIARVLDGRDDYYTNYAIPTAQRLALLRRYGAGHGTGRPRFVVNRNLGVTYLALNTSRPLFARPAVRQAVGFAIDRRALDAQPTVPPFGPGVPADQDLAPGVPGYRDVAVYPLAGPDVARARALAGNGRRRAVMLTCQTAPCPQWGAIVRRDLARIGIDVTVRELPLGRLLSVVSSRSDWDITWFNWGPDFPDGAGVLNLMLHSRALPAHGGYDVSRFADAAYDRRLDAAAALSGPARDAAYAQLDADLTGRAAPLIPFSVSESQDLFSARTGCAIYQPMYGMDLASLCVKSR